MNDLDNLNLNLQISLPALILVITLKVFIFRKVKKKPTFLINTILNFCIYAIEIFLFFGIFQQILINSGTTLSSSGDSMLKQFFNFYTAYQILVFALIKLYDSLEQDHYGPLIHQMEIAQPRIDENAVIENSSDDRFFMETVKYYKDGNFLPVNVKSMYNKLYDLLTEYTELLAKIQIESEEVKKLESNLLSKRLPSEKRKSLQVFLNQLKFETDSNNEEMERIKFAVRDLKTYAVREKGKRDSHWKVSLLLRLFK